MQSQLYQFANRVQQQFMPFLNARGHVMRDDHFDVRDACRAAAIAAQQLTKRFGKVAIVDIDVHHCNGTQFIFWERADVLVCSVHIDPRLSAPYYAGFADDELRCLRSGP